MFNNLEQFYYDAKGNKWFRYFTVFCRIALALGFIPSGIVKITVKGLQHYPQIIHWAIISMRYFKQVIIIRLSEFAQLAIALLLLIPRTALLGAIFYFPTILNICILAYATRFEGTRITTFMLLANLYLLWWDYDRLKHILPFKRSNADIHSAKTKPLSNKFPFAFIRWCYCTL